MPGRGPSPASAWNSSFSRKRCAVRTGSSLWDIMALSRVFVGLTQSKEMIPNFQPWLRELANHSAPVATRTLFSRSTWKG
ncbi:hypothetical protein LEMLEM_LOCUS8456 [Lemmus lemmus]